MKTTIGTVMVIEVAHNLNAIFPKEHKCSQPHGHTEKISLTLTYDYTDKDIIDFGEIKKVLKEFDHKNLNDYLAVPTLENMAWYFAKSLIKRFPQIQTGSIIIYEGMENFAKINFQSKPEE